MRARTYAVRGRRLARQLVSRLTVGLAGAGVLALSGVEPDDVWSLACGGGALTLLVVSSALVLRWVDGPTVFLVSIVVTAAVAPQFSVPRVAVLVIVVAGYLLVVGAAQSGAIGADRDCWLPQLGPLAIGAAIGVVLTLASAVRVSMNGWLPLAAGLLASTAAVGVLLLVGRRP